MKPQTIKQFLVMSILFNLLMTGIVLNTEALLKNGGKMPVLTDSFFATNTHFSYQDKDEVEIWILTDIIKWGNNVWSIGDFILVISITLLTIYGGYSAIQEIRERREEKKNGL